MAGYKILLPILLADKAEIIEGICFGMKRITSGIWKVVFAGLITVPIIGLGSLKVNAASSVPINESTFPDATFRSVIASTYDYNGNGYIDPDEVSMTMNISCEGMGITSVKGIEYFTDIQGLWVKDNNINSLDVSKNVHLHGIWCSGNPISSIDISHNPELEWIYCYDCNLTALDVSHNPEMSFIECNTNPITSLDITKCPKMEHLTCGSCDLASLDLSNCPNLAHLDIFRNPRLTSLDVSKCPKMKRLDIWDNPKLGSIDISHNPGLQYYNCAHNNVKSLDVSHNPELNKLICSYNDLTSLDLSNNPKLSCLYCENNSLKSLDLSHNPRLYYLQAAMNDFTSLNIGYNPFLVKNFNEGTRTDDWKGQWHGYEWTIDYGGDTSTGGDNIFFIWLNADVNVNATPMVDVKNVIPDDKQKDVKDASNLMTREELVLNLYEMAGSPDASNLKTRFTDVPSDAYYRDAIAWAEANHIAVGYPHQSFDTFGTGKYVRREDVAFMLMRYSETFGYKRAIDFGRSDDYIDYYDIDYEHWEAICWTSTWLIMDGKGGATKDQQRIDPLGRATRSDIQYMINRMMEVNNLPAHTIPAAPDPAKVRSFVERLYLVVLGRNGEENGIKGWSNDLLGRKKSGADVAKGFAMSTELKNKNLSDGDFLKTLYKGFFDREPDAQGYNEWMDKLYEGVSREAVIAGFVNSPEYQNLCSRYGIKPGSMSVSAEGQKIVKPERNNHSSGLKPLNVDTSNVNDAELTAFVQRLYVKTLGRDGEASGVEYWKNCILNGRDDNNNRYDIRTVISTGFFLSQEYKNKNTSDEQFVADCYAAFFDRDPRGTDDEVNYQDWVNKLKSGEYNRQQLIEHGFGDSPEFKNLITKYGFIIL